MTSDPLLCALQRQSEGGLRRPLRAQGFRRRGRFSARCWRSSACDVMAEIMEPNDTIVNATAHEGLTACSGCIANLMHVVSTPLPSCSSLTGSSELRADTRHHSRHSKSQADSSIMTCTVPLLWHGSWVHSGTLQRGGTAVPGPQSDQEVPQEVAISNRGSARGRGILLAVLLCDCSNLKMLVRRGEEYWT